MTENHIANNLELTWLDRAITTTKQVDVTNKMHKKFISFIKNTNDGKCTVTAISTNITLSDYLGNSTDYDSLMKPGFSITTLTGIVDVSKAISDTVSQIFKDYCETDKILIAYLSPSSGQKHEQYFYREDTVSLLQSCFNPGNGETNPMPLKTMLAEYGKFVVSLFTADNVKQALSVVQTISTGVMGLFSKKC